MKKLTTGIFTVVLGLVAADANAAVTSKAYVDARVGAVDTKVDGLETTVNDFKTNIGDTITQEIKTNLESPTSDIAKALDAKAGASDVTALGTRVTTAEGDIGNLKSDVANLQTGNNSVANQITSALQSYTNTEGMNRAIANATNDMETQTHAAETYATKTELTTETNARTSADNAINTKIGTLPEGMKDVVAGIADAKKAGTDANAALETYKGTNDAAVKANTDAIASFTNETTGIAATYETKADAKRSHDTLDAAISAEKTRAEAAERANTTAIQTNADAIAANTTDVKKAQSDATQALNESIKKVTATGQDGTYVLTIKTVGDIATLKWEDITREDAVGE